MNEYNMPHLYAESVIALGELVDEASEGLLDCVL